MFTVLFGVSSGGQSFRLSSLVGDVWVVCYYLFLCGLLSLSLSCMDQVGIFCYIYIYIYIYFYDANIKINVNKQFAHLTDRQKEEDRVVLTHCGRVTQICDFNTVKLGTSASSP